MQDCSRYDEMLSALVDGELSEEEARELDAHLSACADCRKYLRLLQTMHEDLGQSLPEAPEMLRQGIMYKVALEPKRRRFGAFGRWTASAAVFVIALLGVVKLTGNDLEGMRGVVADTAKTAAGSMANAAAGSFDYIRENDSAADESSAAGSLMTYMTAAAPGAEAPNPLPQPEDFADGAMANGAVLTENAASEKRAEDAADTEPSEAGGTEAVASIYDASTFPGYEAGMEALNGETAYSGVGILYELPEGLPGRKWKSLPSPDGQRRWLVKKDIMDELAADNVFDELYFGDLLADSGLIIELLDEED